MSKIFYTYTYPVAVCIYSFTLTQGQYKYLSHTLTRSRANVLGCVSVDTKIICKVYPVFGPNFTPKPFFQGYL